MNDEKKPNGDEAVDDDTYVLEDTGESPEQLEQEMELAAQQAAEHIPDAGDPPPAGSVSEEALRKEIVQLKDRVVRTLADYDNFRKRTEREKQDFFRYALGNTMKDLLPVLDNFERALDHAEEGDEFHKGVLLIYKQMIDVLQKAGLRSIEESGIRFDPNVHEAVVREEDPSVPNHTVTGVLQKGYFLHDRLLRPALVKVAMGGPEPAAN